MRTETLRVKNTDQGEMVMRKMKRLLALGLAGMMVLSATGCKSTDKTKDSVAGTTQAAATGGTSTGGTTAAASSEGEDVTLKFTWWGGQTRHELTQQLLPGQKSVRPHQPHLQVVIQKSDQPNSQRKEQDRDNLRIIPDKKQ